MGDLDPAKEETQLYGGEMYLGRSYIGTGEGHILAPR
jgi:hypothetical protein